MRCHVATRGRRRGGVGILEENAGDETAAIAVHGGDTHGLLAQESKLLMLLMVMKLWGR